MSDPTPTLDYERPPQPPAGRRIWPNWRANVIASYGAATVVILAIAAGWASRTQPASSGGEMALAFLASPITLPPFTLLSLVLVAIGREAPTPMHVIVPLVYLALFVPARACFVRQNSAPRNS